MAGKWKQDRRYPVRRRRIQVALASLAFVVIGGALAAWVAPTSEPEVGAIGPDLNADRPLDTSPFSLAHPEVTAQTTLPDVGGLISTTTTTTTPLPTVTLPPAASIPQDDPVCVAIGEMYQLYRDSASAYEVPATFAAAAITRLNHAAASLESTHDQQYRAAALLFRAAASDLVDVKDLDVIGDVLVPLLQATTPAARAAAQPLNDHARTGCPDLVAVHPG